MSRPFRPPVLVTALAAATVGLAGCASQLQTADTLFGLVTPYRIEIVQGNVVTREQIALIKPGMGRSQVRDVLGSPLLTDIFHADRWDYVFSIRRQGTAPQRRHVVLRFDGDVLKSIEAPELPSEQEFVASIARDVPAGKAPVLELTDAQRQALPAPARQEPAPAPPSGPGREYPPLEPT